jgi:nucleotide-binding universal stress UspA family protein
VPLTLEHVMICWDGGRAAARAMRDAMPFLQRARGIEVVIVTNERGKQDQIERADIGAHLARHGFNVKVKRMPVGDVDVADVLLSHAADEGVDFIVMGGYGHSRLREFMLRVTPYWEFGEFSLINLAEHAAHNDRAPVLMSH